MQMAKCASFVVITIVMACRPGTVTITEADYQGIVGRIFVDMPDVSRLDTLYVDLESFLDPPIEFDGQIQAGDISTFLPEKARVVSEETTMSCVTGNSSSYCPIDEPFTSRLVALQDLTNRDGNIYIKLWWVEWHWPDSRCVAKAEYSFELVEESWKIVDMFYPVC